MVEGKLNDSSIKKISFTKMNDVMWLVTELDPVLVWGSF